MYYPISAPLERVSAGVMKRILLGLDAADLARGEVGKYADLSADHFLRSIVFSYS